MKDERESILFILPHAALWFILVVSIVRSIRPTLLASSLATSHFPNAQLVISQHIPSISQTLWIARQTAS